MQGDCIMINLLKERYNNGTRVFWLRLDTAATPNLCSSQLDFDKHKAAVQIKKEIKKNDLMRFYKIPENTFIFQFFLGKKLLDQGLSKYKIYFSKKI